MHRKLMWPRFAMAALIAISLPLLAPNAEAQAAGTATGKIHGQVTDPAGSPETSGTVSMYQGGISGPNTEAKYTLKVGPDGTFSQDNVAPGTYTLAFRLPDTPKDKVVDQINNVKVDAGQDVTQNIDMSRPEYIKTLPPDQQKAIEEAKKKNAGILKENAQIKNLNADLAKARDDDKNKNYQAAADLMQKDAAIKPDAAVLWVELGLAQRGLKQWPDAITSLQKGIQLDSASKKPDPQLEGAAGDALGEAYASAGKIPESQAAYDAAAKINPAGAGMYYQNETIVMARTGNTDATVAAADKAIAADPNRPIPYYLKGQALVNKATVDPKTQKIVAPPGCVEAYQKYLDLAPNGQFAPEAKQVIAEMSQKQENSFKSGKKH
jgi:tetratricopeptide (TPR) repeat protein